MLTLYLDLDGTLIDVSERYWRLHSLLVQRHGLAVRERQQFWTLKRRKASLADMLGGDQQRQAAYWRDWLQCIEAPAFLAYDQVVDGAADALAFLSSRHRLILATMRKDKAALLTQLGRLRLAQFFSAVVLDHSGAKGRSKGAVIAAAGAPCQGRGVIVGDTEGELEAGRILGMQTIMVLSGLRDAAMLTAAGAGVIVQSIKDVPYAIALLEKEEVAKRIPARSF